MKPVVIGVTAIILFFLIFSIFKAPLRLIFKLLINTVVGLAALFLVNYIGGHIGISVPVNWINAVIVGVFGVPGFAVVLILRWITGG